MNRRKRKSNPLGEEFDAVVVDLSDVRDAIPGWAEHEKWLAQQQTNGGTDEFSEDRSDVPSDTSAETTTKKKRKTASDAKETSITATYFFHHEQFGDIRYVMIDGEPWFVGKDVATALGYNDTDQALRRHVYEEDKLTRQIDGLGQRREMILINESGIYALIFGSKLESAKAFKRWVTSEVLPAIRKTGRYALPGALPDQLALDQAAVQREENHYLKSSLWEMQRERAAQVCKELDLPDWVSDRPIAGFQDTPWVNAQMRKIRPVADAMNSSTKWMLHLIYDELEERYGVEMKLYTSYYKYRYHVDTCSALSAISVSRDLKRLFAHLVDELPTFARPYCEEDTSLE